MTLVCRMLWNTSMLECRSILDGIRGLECYGILECWNVVEC